MRQRSKDISNLKRSVSWSPDVQEFPTYQNFPKSPTLTWPLVLLYVFLIFLFCWISLYFYTFLPTPTTSVNPNQFHTSKARSHLDGLTSLGVRQVGGAANEIHAKNFIISTLKQLKREANSAVELEISVQHPSGSYYVNFIGGVNAIYHNLTNVVLRLSKKGSNPENAFMVNAHYDSALGSIGASDDAVSCAIMLEAIRCLSSDPDPLVSENALIFLFNGAEETFYQAAHGFITQHPWASSIRAYMNLEAAGAGGKEIVFRTGPGHSWLAHLYSSVVPYPHASVMAQEVFQSGIIMSDTDFRIFRDFGHLPGIDIAYFINGYVYHTE